MSTMPGRGAILLDIFGRTPHNIKYDLSRISAAVQRMDNPQESYRSIHIAGTNGKGSTCFYCASILHHLGYRVGLFVKPHLVDFEERFIIDGKPAGKDEWIEIYTEYRGMIDELGMTFFEICVLLAFELFRRRRVDWAIFETGLGGRLDATNVLMPRVSTITSLAIDHTAYLGDSLYQIAQEKLGIVKRGVPCVMVEPPSEEIKNRAIQLCRDRNSPLHFVSQDDVGTDISRPDEVSFQFEGKHYSLSAGGLFQPLNAAVAIRTVEQVVPAPYIRVRDACVRTQFPGRFQRYETGGKCVVFDVAHNPSAIHSLLHSLTHYYPGRSVCFVCGFMADKEYPTMLNAIAGVAAEIILCRPDTIRAALPSQLSEAVTPSAKCTVRSFEPVAEAVAAALRSSSDILCITGSFYTVGEAMSALGVTPFPPLM
jgi:dihydrofolate synthase/folylpolyglutamate synthase